MIARFVELYHGRIVTEVLLNNHIQKLFICI